MRETFRYLTAGLSLMILVGCGETPTAPTATPTRSLSAAAPAFDYASAGVFGDQYSSFVVSPAGGSFSVSGLFDINFPAGSICDPDLSSYGESTWDSSCIPLNRSIRITSQLRLSSAGVGIDFSPELRFVPQRQVTISTDVFAPFIRGNRDFFSRYPSALRPFAMYYAPTINGGRVADYLRDPSVITHIDLNSGKVWRRVKHFSGYNITSGQACDPSPGDPDCIEVDNNRGI